MKDMHEKYEGYVSTNSILYINGNGELKRLFCPFRVKAKVDIPPISEGDVVWVEAIKMTPDGMDVYIIGSLGYYVIYFRLV